MRCPDCGAALSEVRIDGTRFVHRCNRCGGSLSDSDTINNISTGNLAGWRRIGVDPKWLVGGDDKCPVCGTRMERYRNDEVPAELPVKRCSRCGKWWLPGDSLFRLKEAQEVKINYFRTWYGTPIVPKLLLPVALTAVIVLALGVGVKLVQLQQRVIIEADAGITAFSTTYLGDGMELVAFRSITVIGEIEYRQSGGEWMTAIPEFADGLYQVELVGLIEGERVEVKIGEKIFEFIPF